MFQINSIIYINLIRYNSFYSNYLKLNENILKREKCQTSKRVSSIYVLLILLL